MDVLANVVSPWSPRNVLGLNSTKSVVDVGL